MKKKYTYLEKIFIKVILMLILWLDKKTIIFDLDETLIHCNESVQIPGDVILPIRFPTGEIIEVYLL